MKTPTIQPTVFNLFSPKTPPTRPETKSALSKSHFRLQQKTMEREPPIRSRMHHHNIPTTNTSKCSVQQII
uniref:Ovule protein n=1 Tax=Ascaris lumbricoides TaxID=6252 RepID=A0A9J2NRA5_ASCLU